MGNLLACQHALAHLSTHHIPTYGEELLAKAYQHFAPAVLVRALFSR